MGEGDTLDGRPFLWWLGGFGIFTMPQEMAVCSIILCIYLASPKHPQTSLFLWRSQAPASATIVALKGQPQQGREGHICEACTY